MSRIFYFSAFLNPQVNTILLQMHQEISEVIVVFQF